MTDLVIEAYRGPIAEDRHRVHVAVADRNGDVLACAGDPEHVTFWRSAAKPIQALAVLRAGTWEHFGWGEEELALASASHSSDAKHVELAMAMLARLELTEADLACGPHKPLSETVAGFLRDQGVELTPAYSNCSGKHASMLALAKTRGWPVQGYQLLDHPVQQSCLEEISRQTGVDRDQIELGTDGCTVVCFGLPLSGMARAYAALAHHEHEGHRTVRAMMEHPMLVGGDGRLCTELMRAYPGQVVAKVGASGVYSAGLVDRDVGIALKVEDGHVPSAEVALLAVLDRYLEPSPLKALAAFARPSIRTTRHDAVGSLRATGTLVQRKASH